MQGRERVNKGSVEMATCKVEKEFNKASWIGRILKWTLLCPSDIYLPLGGSQEYEIMKCSLCVSLHQCVTQISQAIAIDISCSCWGEAKREMKVIHSYPIDKTKNACSRLWFWNEINLLPLANSWPDKQHLDIDLCGSMHFCFTFFCLWGQINGQKVY